MSKKLTAFLFILGFAVCVTSVHNLLPGLLSNIDVYQLLFVVFLFSFILMNIGYIGSRFSSRNKSSGSILMSLLAGVFLFGGIILYSLGADLIKSDYALSLVFLSPFITMALAPVILKEKLNTARMIAVIVAAGGAACIFASGWLTYSFSLNGLLLILAAAVSFSVFTVLCAKTKTATHVNVYIYTAIGIIAATALVFLKSSFILPQIETIGLLALLSVIALIMLFLWSLALKETSVSFWSAMIYIIPAVMLLYETIFKSEAIGFLGIIGLVVIGLSVTYRLSIKI